MKYYIIAGEASGDLHASNLIKQIKLRDANAEFRGWGGDLMKTQEVDLVMHYKDIAFMGFVEVLIHIRKILKAIKFCKHDILQYKPDAVILVDYPGFNLRIAEFVKNAGIKVIYYISPQIWAWKQSRVKKIKAFVDKMLVILPFEKDFYAGHDYTVDFVGHPLLDAIEEKKQQTENIDFIAKNKLTPKPVIAILPGSRRQEIGIMLPIMLQTIPQFSDYQFVVAGVNSIGKEFYAKLMGSIDIPIVYNQTYDLLTNAKAALVTSGTATLETALFQVPEVVCYKANYISYRLAKYFIKIKYISLVNLIMDKPVVKELIQHELNKNNLVQELQKLLMEANCRNSMLNEFQILKEKLGGAGASKRAAEVIFVFLNTGK